VAVQRRDAGIAVVKRFYHGLRRSAATALSIADEVAQAEKAGSIREVCCFVEISKLLLAAVIFEDRIVHNECFCSILDTKAPANSITRRRVFRSGVAANCRLDQHRCSGLNQKQSFANACQSNEVTRGDARRKVEHNDSKQPP